MAINTLRSLIQLSPIEGIRQTRNIHVRARMDVNRTIRNIIHVQARMAVFQPIRSIMGRTSTNQKHHTACELVQALYFA